MNYTTTTMTTTTTTAATSDTITETNSISTQMHAIYAAGQRGYAIDGSISQGKGKRNKCHDHVEKQQGEQLQH